MKKELYEPELKRHLGPVQAPDELWDRVQSTSSQERVHTFTRPVLAWGRAAASLATMAVIAGVFWMNRSLSSEELAVRALNRTPEQMEFRSEDLGELRSWVKASTGLDIPLPGRTSQTVRVIGAHVTRAGVPIAEISYRVGDSDAALVISKAPPQADSKHAFVKSGSYHGANFQSWTMRGQMYTIASANTKMGCMLCHSTGAPRPLVN